MVHAARYLQAPGYQLIEIRLIPEYFKNGVAQLRRRFYVCDDYGSLVPPSVVASGQLAVVLRAG